MYSVSVSHVDGRLVVRLLNGITVGVDEVIASGMPQAYLGHRAATSVLASNTEHCRITVFRWLVGRASA
jgi:hypothetical protein